jgi:hypothetical protein
MLAALAALVADHPILSHLRDRYRLISLLLPTLTGSMPEDDSTFLFVSLKLLFSYQ